jgi:hypothetical protein
MMLEVRRHDMSDKTGGGSMALVACVGAFASVAAGFIIGSRYALPALVLALLWALFLSQAVTVMTYIFPERAEAVIIRGGVYRDEMFDWIRTGDGVESDPRQFIPRHVRDLALFSALALVTGGFGALFLGAVLLNYMNFYVGEVAVRSAHPIAALLFAWQPYALVRVVGYIFIGTALTETFFGTVTRYRAAWPRVKTVAAAGFALALLDVILKALTAPAWSRLLRWITGFGE